MAEASILARAPIVNKAQEILGYRIRLEQAVANGGKDAAITALLASGGQDSFFDSLASRFALLDGDVLDDVKPGSVPANRIIAEVDTQASSGDALVARIKKLKGSGLGVCLQRPYAASVSPEALDLATYLSLDGAELKAEFEKTCNRLRKHSAKQMAVGVDNLERFEAAHQAGCNAFQGYFFTVPSLEQSQAINPSYTTIVSLMKLAQESAPVAKIEEALKRDAALSFKLLRYINSAGFGLSCEIQSFRHAVAVLGCRRGSRWLALLMVTAARQSASPALVTTAIVRGRLAELLGQSLFDAQERDNLFIVGAFSLLDAILRVKSTPSWSRFRCLSPCSTRCSATRVHTARCCRSWKRLNPSISPPAAAKLSRWPICSASRRLSSIARSFEAVVWAEALGS